MDGRDVFLQNSGQAYTRILEAAQMQRYMGRACSMVFPRGNDVFGAQ